MILRQLLVETKRFSELKKNILGISQKVLTQNLRSMEDDGILIRTVYAEVPPRVEYSLSPIGETLKTLFIDMETWGNTYKEQVVKDK